MSRVIFAKRELTFLSEDLAQMIDDTCTCVAIGGRKVAENELHTRATIMNKNTP